MSLTSALLYLSPIALDLYTPVTWCDKVKYLGVVITLNLKWNDHCQHVHVVHRATQSLNQLSRPMYGCTDRAKALAYLALVRPHLEHCNVIWTLYTSKNIDLCNVESHDG